MERNIGEKDMREKRIEEQHFVCHGRSTHDFRPSVRPSVCLSICMLRLRHSILLM